MSTPGRARPRWACQPADGRNQEDPSEWRPPSTCGHDAARHRLVTTQDTAVDRHPAHVVVNVAGGHSEWREIIVGRPRDHADPHREQSADSFRHCGRSGRVSVVDQHLGPDISARPDISDLSARWVDQELRPALGLRPWLAFFFRALIFFLLVRFDMVTTRYRLCRLNLK
jgi:hypothetical protein